MVRKRSTKIRPTPHGARSAPIFPRAAPGTHGRTHTRQEEPGLPRPGRPASGGGVMGSLHAQLFRFCPTLSHVLNENVFLL